MILIIFKGMYAGTELNEVIFFDSETKTITNFNNIMNKSNAMAAKDVSGFSKLKKAVKYFDEKRISNNITI